MRAACTEAFRFAILDVQGASREARKLEPTEYALPLRPQLR